MFFCLWTPIYEERSGPQFESTNGGALSDTRANPIR